MRKIEIFKLFGSVFIKDEASAELGKIEQTADGTASKFETMGDKFGKVGKVATNVGKSMTTKLSLPIVGLGTVAVKSAMDFEGAMSEVSALSGATGSDLGKLEDIAREMGSSTTFSAQESAEALKYMSLAGWNTEEMVSALEPTLKLAGAAGMELGIASDIVTDTLSMFGMEASEATKMTDMLAYAQANSNTDVEGLGEALKYAGAGANAMGYDLADTAAILGTFADQGLKGSAAGTTLNAMFTDMKKNSEDGAIAIGDTSVAIVDANGNYRDMADIVTDVESATKDMTQAEKDQALSAIFGTQAIKGMNMILEAGSDTLKDFEDGIRSSDGAASDMYDTMNDNLQGSFENLKSALGETAISMGTLLIPVLQQGVEWITSMIDKFNGLDDSTKKIIIAVLAVVAAIGPLLLIFGTLATKVSAIMGLFTTVSGSMATTGIAGTALGGIMSSLVGIFTSVILPIAAVGTALVVLYKNSETFRDGINGVFKSVKETISSALDFIVTLFKSTWDVLVAVFNVFSALFSGDFEKFSEAIKKLGTTLLKALQDIFKSGFELIGNIVKTAWKLIETIFKTAFKGIENVVKVAWKGIQKLFEVPLKAIQKTIETVLKAIEKVFTVAFLAIKLVVETSMTLIKTSIELVMNVIKAIFETIWNVIGDTVKKAVDKIKDVVTKGFNKVKDVVTKVFNEVKNVTDKVWNGISQVITTVVNKIKSTITSIFNSIKSTITSIWNSVKSVTSSVWNSISSTISSVVNGVKSTVTSVFNSIKSTTTSVWNNVKNAMIRPVEEAKNKIQSIINRVKGFFSNIRLKFPKIQMPPLPHFKLNGSFSLNPPSVPKLGVDWYKDGGIMTNPTAFGMNGNNVMAGGEAGHEAILPLNSKTLGGIGKGIAGTMGSNNSGSQNIENNFNISSLVIREEADIKKIAKELFNIQQRSNRGRGLSTV